MKPQLPTLAAAISAVLCVGVVALSARRGSGSYAVSWSRAQALRENGSAFEYFDGSYDFLQTRESRTSESPMLSVHVHDCAPALLFGVPPVLHTSAHAVNASDRAAGTAGFVQVWDAATGKPLTGKLETEWDDNYTKLMFSADGKVLFDVGYDSSDRNVWGLWDTNTESSSSSYGRPRRARRRAQPRRHACRRQRGGRLPTAAWCEWRTRLHSPRRGLAR